MLLKLLGSELGAGSPNKLGSTSHLQEELGRHLIAKKQREEIIGVARLGRGTKRSVTPAPTHSLTLGHEHEVRFV